MLLEVKREPSAFGCTLGNLYVDGQYECFTLEDVVREVPEEAVEKWKVPGETAIPVGTYDVIVTLSNRFQRLLPLLMKVPGFEGVRIHPSEFLGRYGRLHSGRPASCSGSGARFPVGIQRSFSEDQSRS
jgi:Family of unknown function (DUF5675)